MNRLLYLFIGVFIFYACEAVGNFEADVATLTYKSMDADLSSISPGDRKKTIDLLRKFRSREIKEVSTIVPNQSGAEILLVRLNDSETIDKMISVYQKYNSRAAWSYIPKTFERAAQPAVIPYLAGDYFGDEPANANYGKEGSTTEFGIIGPPKSIYSGVITLRVIQAAPEFNVELKHWAKEVYELRIRNPEGFRKLMRQWWEQNKEAFEKGDYASVTAVPIKTYEVKPPGPVPQEAINHTEPNPLAPPNQEATSTIKSDKPVVTQLTPVVQNTSWLVIAGAVIAVLLAGSGFIWFLRKPSNS